MTIFAKLTLSHFSQKQTRLACKFFIFYAVNIRPK
nr:MAG TPA: hypothetical protein [Caudoviricetes sp.]